MYKTHNTKYVYYTKTKHKYHSYESTPGSRQESLVGNLVVAELHNHLCKPILFRLISLFDFGKCLLNRCKVWGAGEYRVRSATVPPHLGLI